MFISLGKYVKAKEYIEKSLEITIKIGDRTGEAKTYGILGNMYQSLGDYDKAKEYYEKALVISMEIGDRENEASSYGSLGAVFQSLGEYVIAEEYIEKALLTCNDIKQFETEFRCYCVLSLTKLSQGKFQEACFYLFRSIEKCEDLQGFNANNDQIKVFLTDMHVFPYQLLSRLFCDTGIPNRALYVVELGRARALADLMATQYSAEKHISASPQSWIGIENVMTKERNGTCVYISYHAQRVFLWILRTSGVNSFREMTVDEKVLYRR